MKKKLFNNASKLIMSALLLPFVITSCKKNTADVVLSNSNDVTSSAQARQTGLAEVSLKVTVNAGNNITSDGKGVYINGTQNVRAIIDGLGNFLFSTQASNSKTAVVRWVNYNFDQPFSGYLPLNLTVDHTKPCDFAMIKSNLPGYSFTPLQNLGANQSECVTLFGSFSSITSNYRVSFHRGQEDVSTSPTAFALVTRTSINPAVWTITPIGTCSPKSNANVAALRSDDGTVLYGYYYLPFFFTLTAQ